MFDRYVGIDYSGAGTASSPLSGLRVYRTEGLDEPREVRPLPDARRHWTRATVADWLTATIDHEGPALIGIDHGFSFPRTYFERYASISDWPAFLADFRRHWPLDRPGVRVEDVRRGVTGDGASRSGDARWRRLTERRAGGAKSVFHFDVPGSVAKSTFSGLPWLHRVREQGGDRVHVWPFDGWRPPAGRSVLAEVYPSLWQDRHSRGDRTPDQHDAYVVAAGLRDADRAGELPRLLTPVLAPAERAIAAMEGWILGVS